MVMGRRFAVSVAAVIAALSRSGRPQADVHKKERPYQIFTRTSSARYILSPGFTPKAS
jgi:hypothetical protein